MQLHIFSNAFASETNQQVPNTQFLALQVFMGLVLVLALMFSLAWLAKRLNFSGGLINSSGLVRLLAVKSLGSKEKLLLVEVGEEQLLLGVTSQNISCLHKLTTKLDVPEPNNKNQFNKLVQQWIKKENPDETPT